MWLCDTITHHPTRAQEFTVTEHYIHFNTKPKGFSPWVDLGFRFQITPAQPWGSSTWSCNVEICLDFFPPHAPSFVLKSPTINESSWNILHWQLSLRCCQQQVLSMREIMLSLKKIFNWKTPNICAYFSTVVVYPKCGFLAFVFVPKICRKHIFLHYV